MPNSFFFNEPVQVLEASDEKITIQYEDGTTEEVPPDHDQLIIYDVPPLKKNSSPIKPYNKERREEAFERNFGSKERVEAVSRMGCVVCGAVPCHNAHVTPRGMGGAHGDKKDVVPLCPTHHREQEEGTEAFEEKYSVDLTEEAAKVSEVLDD